MSSFIDIFLEFLDFLDELVKKVCIFIAAMMTLTIILQVSFRYILKNPLVWTEELSRYLMIYMAFIGASSVIKRWENIYVDYFINKLKEKSRNTLLLFIKFCVLAVLMSILYLSMTVFPNVSRNQVTAAMGISMLWPQAGMIIGLFLMVLQLIGVIIRDITGRGNEQ
ncbi:TRAP transporter small permease [Petroclostridium sp. X23]|uniref:TRAP transporter small permease n=1 Tax=Petroclostridium sp. X23 TaxID=3045146 RepID=UPI0024AE47C9|nr:TRAP transporter small permease [Petroclostridium sp. X23]WHH58024.1 TRAP transporter small permease [Petroclostridium sp. X23]